MPTPKAPISGHHQTPVGRLSLGDNLGDRRLTPRDTPQGEPSRSRLVKLIESSYLEMPGLSLHVEQAARLFGLRETTCRLVLDDLVRRGRLRRAPDGQYRLV